MKFDDVGEVIAVRKLSVLREGEPPMDVLALLGKPEQLPGLPDYYCPYQIKGAGSETVICVFGTDTFQALQLAIRSLAGDLDLLNKHLQGNLRWEGDEKGWLGFPSRSDPD
jgi:hypothetical protein